jgi:hypothetical protein
MPRKKRLKDTDLADKAQRLQAGTWAFAVASLLGTMGGAGIAYMNGLNPILGAVLGFVLMFSGIYFGSMRILGGAASAVGALHNPSGSSTPARREYSRAQSLVARGLYEEAAVAYEAHCVEYGEDPEPYFRLARLLRDHLNKPEESVSWFKRARADAKLTSGQKLQITQEIIELYIRKLRKPRKALPELAYICKEFPDAPAADGARRELAEMRAMLDRERDGTVDFTTQFLARFTDRSGDSAGGGSS